MQHCSQVKFDCGTSMAAQPEYMEGVERNIAEKQVANRGPRFGILGL